MIEMRWLEKWVDDYDSPRTGEHPLKKMERVLQYRESYGLAGTSIETFGELYR